MYFPLKVRLYMEVWAPDQLEKIIKPTVQLKQNNVICPFKRTGPPNGVVFLGAMCSEWPGICHCLLSVGSGLFVPSHIAPADR